MKRAVITGGVLAALGVTAGAFGAHGLKEMVRTDLYETAVLYHLIHAMGIVLVGAVARDRAVPALRVSAGLFLVGIVLFCGSLYALSLHGPKWLGMVAPVGGLALILGWIALAVGAWRSEAA